MCLARNLVLLPSDRSGRGLKVNKFLTFSKPFDRLHCLIDSLRRSVLPADSQLSRERICQELFDLPIESLTAKYCIRIILPLTLIQNTALSCLPSLKASSISLTTWTLSGGCLDTSEDDGLPLFEFIIPAQSWTGK